MSATSLETLAERLAKRLQSMTEFTASGGSTTTAISNELYQPDDDYWVGAWLYCKSGASFNVGIERPVTAFAAASDTLTVGYGFASAIANTHVLQLFSRWSHADLVDAINAAVRETGGYWWRSIVDESITTTDASSYALNGLSVPPEERHGMDSVSFQINTADATRPYQRLDDWEIRWALTVPTLQLRGPLTSGRKLRLQYRVTPAEMTVKTDTTGVDKSTWIDNFLVEWAVYLLRDGLVGHSPDSNQRTEDSESTKARNEAERLRGRHGMQLPPTFVRRPRKLFAMDDGTYLAANRTPSA